jgi:hypothetical protein
VQSPEQEGELCAELDFFHFHLQLVTTEVSLCTASVLHNLIQWQVFRTVVFPPHMQTVVSRVYGRSKERIRASVGIFLADHSGRLLEHWDHGFESHSRHGYLCAFILCLCCSLCR